MMTYRTSSLAIAAVLGALFLPSTDASAARPSDRAVDWAKRGDSLVLVGSVDRAIAAYQKALGANPKLDQTRVRLAHCLWKAGKTDDALGQLARLLEAPQPPIEALRLLADIHLDRKNYLEARGVLEKLHQRTPSDLRVKLQLADCYRQMATLGNPEARARALALLLEVEKAASDPALRRRAMESSLTMRFGEHGHALLEAKAAIAAGKAADAVKTLDGIAAKLGDLPYLNYLRGMAYLAPELDNRARAIAALTKAKGLPEAELQLGVLHYEDGDLDRAEASLKLAAAGQSTSQRVHYQLGLVYRERGDDKQAIASWRRAVAIDSTTPMARWAAAKMQVLTGRLRSLAPGQVIDPATEILIGKKTCQQLEKRWPVLKEPRLQARLERILDRLLEQSDRPKRDLRYKLAIINVPVANALTVPNGKIYLFTGLIDLIRSRLGDSDDAYAAVLAHEISHNALRHGAGIIKMASTQKAYNSLWQLSRLMSAVSRAHEYEADQYGALYAYRAGFNPVASIELHRKMLQHRGEIPEGMTHPRHRDRIARLRDYLLELRAKVRYFDRGVSSLKQDKYDDAVDNFELFLGVLPDSLAARNNLAVALHRKALTNTKAAPIFRRSTDVDPDARLQAIKLRSTEEERRRRHIDKQLLREAIGEYATVLRTDSRYAVAHNNMATALADLGDFRGARRHVELALKLRPAYKEALNNRGVMLAQSGDLAGAERAFLAALGADDKYPAARFNLALLTEKRSRKADALVQWNRYLALDGEGGWAAIARARKERLSVQAPR